MFKAAELADQAQTVALWKRCGLTTPQNLPEADFERAIMSSSSCVFVAILDDRVVGCVMVGDDGHRAVVYYLGVDPTVRIFGLGRQLMTEAETWAKARGATKLNLMVREDNKAVFDFYDAIGYEETPRLVMAKWLDT